MTTKKRYLCPECDKVCSKQEGCLCDRCGEILLADKNREILGDDADYFEAAGITDIGYK